MGHQSRAVATEAASTAAAWNAAMTLCRLLVWDFTDSTGRYDADGGQRYNEMDIRFGAAYARALIDDGYTTEQFLGFELAEFAEWCDYMLGDI